MRKKPSNKVATKFTVPEFSSLDEMVRHFGTHIVTELLEAPMQLASREAVRIAKEKDRKLYAKALAKWLKNNKAKHFTIFVDGGSSTGKSLDPT